MDRMTRAVVFATIIAATSVAVAYVTFSILESSAEANLQNWKLGGAFAAFVFTAFLLTSVILQLHRQLTAEEVETYRKQVTELQSKLIRGASPPEGYVVDLDEKHSIVFSRPAEWRPKENLLYQYVHPGFEKPPRSQNVARRGAASAKKDEFLANFNVLNMPEDTLEGIYLEAGAKFNPDRIVVEELYGHIVASMGRDSKEVLTGYQDRGSSTEYIKVDGHKSMKHVQTYSLKVGDGRVIDLRTVTVCTYVPRLKAAFVFTFSDNKEDFLHSSDVFNTVVSSIRFL